MFDLVHENKKFIQIVLALIVLPFALWGVSSYKSSDGGAALATVDGEKIHQQEFDNALRQQQARMREIMGSRFDPAMLDKPGVKQSLLENLVEQHLLALRARAAGLAVSDEQLAQVIAGIGAFQKDGKFDKQRYETLLRSQNMSPAIFESRVQQELILRQLTDAYTSNGYASDSVADNLIRINEQTRVVSTSLIAADSFLKQAAVDDAAAKAYYENNAAEFRVPEQARVEYVVLSADALLPQMAVSDAEIRKYYGDHQQEFGTQEQRHAAHILIPVAMQASEADKEAARAKAEKILQQVKQSPGKFADFARQYSQDPGSAKNGGDLGMFGRGMMVKPFDDAVFQLKPGEISGLVQSDFGFHIIKLLGVNPAKIQPLDKVKDEIAQRLKLQKADDKFAELADKFSNVVYEQSDTLKPAAELVKGPLQQSAWLNKGQAGVPPWTDKALQAVFSKEVLSDRRNSAAVEIAPNTLMSVRLLEYKPASTRPFAEVRDAIRQKLQYQQAMELATKQGKATLEQLKRGEKMNLVWKSGQSMTRMQHPGQSNDMVRQVFQVNTAKLPAYAGMENSQGGYLLVRVDEVKDIAAVDDAMRARYAQEIRQLTGNELLQAYTADARKHADISMKPFAEGEKQ